MRNQLDERSDRALLEATRSGDSSAFEVFYRRHCGLLLGYYARRVRNAEVAADLLAEAFTAALVAVHDATRPLPASPLSWLFTIAQRKLIDSLRRGRVEDEARRRLQLEPMVLEDQDIERIEEIAGRTDVLRELARRLPPDQFEALRARVVEERSYSDAAQRLRCSEAVVRKRVSRALSALRTAMGDMA